MLGHPGFSAMEYAGVSYEAEKAKEKKKSEGFLKRATVKEDASPNVSVNDEDSPPTAKTQSLEADLQQAQIDEIVLYQRQRGTFINHTPRTFEVRSSKKVDIPQASLEGHPGTHASYHGSSDENTIESSSPHGQRSSFESWDPENILEVNASRPVELDSNELIGMRYDDMPTASSDSAGGSKSSSLMDKIIHRTPGELSPSPVERKVERKPLPPKKSKLDVSVYWQPPSDQPEEINSKNSAMNSLSLSLDGASDQPDTPKARGYTPSRQPVHNRGPQTPRHVQQLASPSPGRHSPLEPLVARHRRGITSSDVDPLPPHEDVNNIVETSDLVAIQEYYNRQNTNSSHTSATGNSVRMGHDRKRHPVVLLPSSPLEGPPSFPVDGLEAPGSPTPNPFDGTPPGLGLGAMDSHHRDRSGHSLYSDFASAAEGQYSPYDGRYDQPAAPQYPEQSPELGAEQVVSPTSRGSKAPPVPPNDEMRSNTKLNDFNYFIRQTGPPPSAERTSVRVKKESPLEKLFKPRSKKNSAEKVEATVPGCARVMTTSGGAKHLQIVIPSNELHSDQTVTLPVEDSPGGSRRVSVTWTDEMLQPLASNAVEDAISGSNFVESSSPLRGPRPSPVSPTSVPVDSHPLAMTREEQTRLRKLRDLRKAVTKRKESAASGEENGAGGPSVPPGEAPKMMEVSVKEFQAMHHNRRLVNELAMALATSAGLDATMRPEKVLEAYKNL